MPLFQAIGLGVLIIVLKFLAPAVLLAGEQTAVAFLNGATVSATAAAGFAERAGEIEISHEPFALPQAPQIRTR